MKRARIGQRIILPDTNEIGIVTKLDYQGLPTQIKTKDGLISVIGKAWDVFSLAYKLIRLIRLIFQR